MEGQTDSGWEEHSHTGRGGGRGEEGREGGKDEGREGEGDRETAKGKVASKEDTSLCDIVVGRDVAREFVAHVWEGRAEEVEAAFRQRVEISVRQRNRCGNGMARAGAK